MKKNLPNPSAEIRVIPKTQYILLPDNKVARLLTPTVRNGVTYYNLFVPGYTRLLIYDAATRRAIN